MNYLDSDKDKLKNLYRTKEIEEIWKAGQTLKIIQHPELGMITPHHYRSLYRGQKCPYCQEIMVQGKEYIIHSEKEARKRGYRYINSRGEIKLNRIDNNFYPPNYVTIDHKLNKARFPEKMFDFDNLEAICWRCNEEKSDNNAFKIQQEYKKLRSITEKTLENYPLL